MKNGRFIKELIIDIAVDLLAGLMIAVATYNFAAAMKFPMVGMTGIALIFYHLFGTPIGLVSALLNIPIALVCWKLLGRKFLINSVKSIIITSAVIDLVAPLLPAFHGNEMLAAIATAVLSGAGYGLIFRRNSSTGGTDFIIMAAKAAWPHISLSSISFATEAIIIALGAAIISKNVEAMLYGLIISYLMSKTMDQVTYATDSGKMLMIVTDHPEKIAWRIDEATARGCTYIDAQGSYTGAEKKVVMCACNNKQAQQIRTLAGETDPMCFTVILDAGEVYGEGFKRHH